MENIEILQEIQFFINRLNKTKMIAYKSFRYSKKHSGYEFYNKFEKLKLGVQLCDFINTDFNSMESAREFIDKYSIIAISGLSNVNLYTYYNENEYEEMIKNVVKKSKDKLEKYKKAFIEDIKYIYNLNDLAELYEKEFQEFKEKNVELKEKINNGKLTQEEYIEWLNKQ